MEEQDRIIYYNGLKYIIINSTRYLGNKYIFVINYDNANDVKILLCQNELDEIYDIDLIKKIILQMN